MGVYPRRAETLGYTQSGVTHMMRSLEEEAGFPLLLRGNRGVKFTAEGERLAPLFRELLQASDRLEQEMALTRGVERGSVKIGNVFIYIAPLDAENTRSLSGAVSEHRGGAA